MGKYCCFFCPDVDYSEKSLDEPCPKCLRNYGFPLEKFPEEINDYKLVKSLGRGFYAATYVAERGSFGRKVVLRISPQVFYSFFSNKDFESECRLHASVAEGTEHIVDIREMFQATVGFGDIDITCNIAELDYIEGKLLADYLDSIDKLAAPTVAQIAVDLFRIRDELKNKGVNHNDLHAENIIIAKLGRDARRAHAIDDSVRAVAIDLGSISDGSLSDFEHGRRGDIHWIWVHLNSLITNLLSDPDEISDLDNRLAHVLQFIVHSIAPSAENQRTPESSDFISQIESAYHRATEHWRPWREVLTLRTFSESYNAQTMRAWHVPQLLVDPDGQWFNAMRARGPQVVTGMRGCGKTMLLMALQFHARAAQIGQESNKEIVERIKGDGFIGLFVSARLLLDQIGTKTETAGDPIARLFLAYGLEAVRSIHHLKDLDEECVAISAYREISDAIEMCLETGDYLTNANTAYELENKLSSLLISLSRGQKEYKLTIHPSMAFETLVKALRCCSPIWESADVLFLLDDVSTRNLEQYAIEDLLSALLFQSSTCAFKLTSEAQTIELGLKSPGKNHPARIGRDLNLFDLGAEVYGKIKKQGKGNGKEFVEAILQQRARYFAGHPDATPRKLLGDVTLETIAKEIGESRTTSAKRKSVYRGISALAGVCVGDIGDVISLYEQILRKEPRNSIPIASKFQSECFQDFCATRLYDLNRRGGFLKNIAKSFAEASYDLLVNSCKNQSFSEVRRIRQYSSLYVRITTGDIEKQTDRLRELIDAGVFVFAGGSNVPRTKTRDSNPTQQFKLTYRKIYGLVNFIGLAERDRFELSGTDLEEWLDEPSRGKEILLRNLGGDREWEDRDSEEVEGNESDSEDNNNILESGNGQITLFEMCELYSELEDDADVPRIRACESPFYVDRILDVDSNFSRKKFDVNIETIVLGLGFEERTLESVRRAVHLTGAKRAVTVKYEEKGKSSEILKLLSQSMEKQSMLDYKNIIDEGFEDIEGDVLVDITGLAKPVIFHAVRNELRKKGKVWICHTEAEKHYPLDCDLHRILIAEMDRDRHVLLEELQGVLTGEEGPYKSDNLLMSDSDETRQRVLCAASSPKHERLHKLLDDRVYDRLEIIAPLSESPRSRIAKIAADVAAHTIVNSNVTQIDTNDLDGMLKFIVERYRTWYIDNGYNFELGLTGSKLQAVACSAASAAFKISQCWYIRPNTFDPHRFTNGVGESHIYEISLRPR